MLQPQALKSGVSRGQLGDIWYGVAGDGDKPPLVTLHGGPGGTHDYLANMASLADVGRPVIFYDQLGCGRSDTPKDPSLYTLEYFVSEIDQILNELDVTDFHLYGQSWGGILAIEYALKFGQSKGLRSLVLDSTTASVPQIRQEFLRLIRDCPPDVRRSLMVHISRAMRDGGDDKQAISDTLSLLRHAVMKTSPRTVALGAQTLIRQLWSGQTLGYMLAALGFSREHMCRLNPWPDSLMYSAREMLKSPAYVQLWGDDYAVTGTLKDWDRIDDLPQISVPTLVIVGKYGEAPPECSESIHSGIPRSEYVLFDDSAHFPNLEEPALFLATVGDFLAKHDGE